LPFSDGIRRKIAEFPEHADLIRAWDSRWADFYGGHDQGVVAVLQDLRVAGVPLFACTNWPGEKFPLARKMFPFLNWFGDIIVSGDEGVSKPDAKIFRILIDRCVLDPHHTLFIDDSAANVSAAQSHGFITHHFKDSEGLQVAINDLGL
jgi:2-haloacid dehalogenase